MGSASLSSAKIKIGRYLLDEITSGRRGFDIAELAEVGDLNNKYKVADILRESYPSIFRLKRGMGDVELNINGVFNSKDRDEKIKHLRTILIDLENYAESGENRTTLVGDTDSNFHQSRIRWR